MSSSYFPVDYFNDSMFGLTNGTTQTDPGTGNLIMSLAENIATGLASLLVADSVLIYADSEFPVEPPTRERVVIELFPRLLQTNPIITGSSSTVLNLTNLDYSVRITYRTWPSRDYAPIMQAMTSVSRYLTGNSFGLSVANRSRIEKMTVREIESGVHQIFVLAHTSALG